MLSTRCAFKNLLTLDSGRSLVQRKLDLLSEVAEITDLVLLTSHDEIEVFEPCCHTNRARIVSFHDPPIREDLSSLWKDVAEALTSSSGEGCSGEGCSGEGSSAHTHIGYASAMSPFLTSESVRSLIQQFQRDRYDSALTIHSQHHHLLPDSSDGALVSVKSQDLPPSRTITFGLCIAPIERFRAGSCLGTRPFCLEVSETEAFDIDSEFDLSIAVKILGLPPYRRLVKEVSHAELAELGGMVQSLPDSLEELIALQRAQISRAGQLIPWAIPKSQFNYYDPRSSFYQYIVLDD